MRPIALACACALSLAATCPATALTNLLANGDFESGTLAGWNANGATASTAEAHHGTWSARLTTQTMDCQIDTIPGHDYKLTGWVRIVAESGSDWGGFRLEAVSDAWVSLGSSGFLTRAERGGDWFKVALPFRATTARTRIEVGYFGGGGRAMTTHADDLWVFERGVNAPPTVDASLAPASLALLPGTQSFQVTADDGDGAIVRVDWDFGDGLTSQAFAGSRRAGVPGTFVARVRVADDDGAVVARTIPWTASDPAWPAVAITDPATDDAVVSDADLRVSGTSIGATTVRVVDERGGGATAAGLGSWQAVVRLAPGWNRLAAQAANAAGRVAVAERRVRYVPRAALAIENLAESAPVVFQYEPLEITFTLSGSAATYPSFPYDPAPPPGLESLDGASVDVDFVRDGDGTVYRRPAFLAPPFARVRKAGQEWMYPAAAARWTARFAPPQPGRWTYTVHAVEARGTADSAARAFNVLRARPQEHGPVGVAATDTRYFEHADGTPFLGGGHGAGASAEAYSFDFEDQLALWGAGNEQLLRFWIAGHLWGSAWQPWASRTLGYDGTVPVTGLTLAARTGDGLAALRVDNANPVEWQGFMSGHAAVIPGRRYRVRVRWRVEGVTGPVDAAKPWGVAVRLVDWPDPGHTDVFPLVVPHVHGDAPWHVAEGEFVAQAPYVRDGGDFARDPALVFENASGGQAYVDEVSLREVLGDGTAGPELLRTPRVNAHLAFDARRGAGLDAILDAAARRGVTLRLVISEKQEWLLGHLGPDGLPDALGGHFNAEAGTAGRRLHEAYWRHLSARYGAWRSVHSFELVNEEAPGPGAHFRLAAALAQREAADGNPHLTSTSTWATLAESAWKDPAAAPISSTDFHCYVRGTGWIEPKDELARDSARFMHEYDEAARAAGFDKPVVWGEQGIDANGNEDPGLALDLHGVWLSKLTWARTGPGGTYPLYWWTGSIDGNGLHGIYGTWRRFMAGVPLANGRYLDAAATVSNPALRAFGQKDTAEGRAHVWIDNGAHTWDAVVAGRTVAPASGTVTLDLGAAGASYTAAWYDTATGQTTRTETLAADAAGRVTLTVNALATDTAVRLTRASAAAPGEATDWAWSARDAAQWNPAPRAALHRVYRGTAADLAHLDGSAANACLRWTGAGTATGGVLTEKPAAGALYWYLAVGENAGQTGPAGDRSAGARVVVSRGPCS